LIRSHFKDLPREVSILILASFFVAIGYGIVMPAIPVFAKTFGVTNAAIGLIVSAFAITRFASGLVSGALTDRFGERKVFAVGVFMVAVFTLLAGLAQNYQQLLVFRAAGGLGSSMFSVAAGSVIMRSVDDQHRGQAQSVYQGAFLLGGIAGPAVGGLLSIISLRAPFFVYSILLFVSGIVALAFLKSDSAGHHINKSKESESTSIAQAFAMKPYRIALILAFISTWVFFGLRSSILPIFVIEELNSTTAVVGYGLALSAILQGVFL
jgi:MFS family permease